LLQRRRGRQADSADVADGIDHQVLVTLTAALNGV